MILILFQNISCVLILNCILDDDEIILVPPTLEVNCRTYAKEFSTLTSGEIKKKQWDVFFESLILQ
jgi:hypothetical protein